MLAALECVSLAALQTVWPSSAQAQFFGDQRYPFLQRRQRSHGFFQDLFGNPRRGDNERYNNAPRVDHSRAPAPRKQAKDAPPPTTSVVVLGDGMADWLAYGLEQAFADTPSVGIVRDTKLHSGLIRYEAKGDLDWWHQARDILTKEKANYVVMMLGLNDRENIRERDLEKEAEKQKSEKEAAEKKKAEKNGDKSADQNKDKDKGKKEAEKKAEESKPKPKPSNGVIDFRSARWAAVYAKRIDETIAALKSKGVPVFWVGLPSIRGTKSTADAVYLNDLFRARAERAGIVYIDDWDGFVDDGGKFSSYGPDYEGQTRRLRSSDGVFFTKYGARKLAHYVEREIRRYMSNRSLQVSLPSAPVNVPKAGKSTERPVVGPVVPLTATTGVTDELLGGADRASPHGDSIATRVLVNGEPVAPRAGRADNFAWPPGSAPSQPQPADQGSKPKAERQSSLQPATAPGPAKRPIRVIKQGQSNPLPGEKKPKPAQADGKAKATAQNGGGAKPTPPAAEKPQPAHTARHRERGFPFHFNFKDPFGFLR